MKVLIYFDGLNEVDKKGSSLWNISISLAKTWVNALNENPDVSIKAIIPAQAYYMYDLFLQKPSLPFFKTTMDVSALHKFMQKVECVPMDDDDLTKCFSPKRTLQESYIKDLENNLTSAEQNKLKNLILGKLNGWQPDLVVSYPLNLHFLRKVFPSIPIFVNEWAVFSRRPLPTSIYFDVMGGVDKSFLYHFRKDIQGYAISEEENDKVEGFKQNLQKRLRRFYNVDKLVQPYLKKFRKTILVPLVPLKYSEGVSPFPDEDAVIRYVMERVPSDVGVFFTGHFGVNHFNWATIWFYRHKYPNFIYVGELQNYPMASVALFPFVDAVANLISMTGAMAKLWDIPVIPLCKNYNAWIADCESLNDLEDVLAKPRVKKNGLIYWYFTHYAVWEKRYDDRDFFHNFFEQKLDKFKNGKIKFDFYEKIEDFDDVAQYVEKSLWEFIKPQNNVKPSEKKTFYLFNKIPVFYVKKKANKKVFVLLGIPLLKIKKKAKTKISILGIPFLSY